MDNRYKRLFSLSTNLYAEGMPIIFEAGALLRDNQSDSILVQLKIHNVSPKTIKALKVHIIGYDSFGAEVCNTDFQYIDRSVKRGHIFGVQTPIFLNNNSVRSFSVSAVSAVFLDGDIWNGNNKVLTSIRTISPSDYFQKQPAIEQYRIIYGNDAEYIYSEHFDLWLCICGNFNHKNEDTCFSCKRKQEDIKKLPDENELSKQGELRVKNQIKEQKYYSAVKLYESDSAITNDILKNLEAAKNIFEELGDYKDSSEYAIRCADIKTKIETEAENQKKEREKAEKRKHKIKMRFFYTTAAVIILSALIVITNNSIILIIPEIKYQEAMKDFQNDLISSAMDKFMDLGYYKDSEKYYTYMDYILKVIDDEADKETLHSVITELENLDADRSQEYKNIALETYYSLIKKDYDDGIYSDLLNNIDFLSKHGYDKEKCEELKNEYINEFKDLSGEYNNLPSTYRSFLVNVDLYSGTISIVLFLNEELEKKYSFDLNKEKNFYMSLSGDDYVRFSFIKNTMNYTTSVGYDKAFTYEYEKRIIS